MENNLKEFKEKLKLLTFQLNNLDANNDQVKQLKKSVYVLNKILNDDIVSPYGPHTSIVPYSLN